MIEEVKQGVFLQQTKSGWRLIKPIKKDINRPFSFKDNVNWKHFLIGDWNRLFTFILILAVILFVAWAYKHDMEACAEKYAGECMAAKTNPCYSKCFHQCNLDVNDLIKPSDDLRDFTLKNGTG